MNLAVISGRITGPLRHRDLEGGSVLELDVKVPKTDDRPAETVNVAWLDPPARALDLGEDDAVLVVGRVRRRFFQARGDLIGKTEVVAESVLRTSRAKAAERALADAVALLEEAPLVR